MRLTAGVLFTWLTLPSCRQTPVAPKATGAVVFGQVSGDGGNQVQREAAIKTTSGVIAVSGLEGQIEELGKLLDLFLCEL